VAVRTFELPRRLPITHRPLTSDRKLATLIAGGHSDTDIATRYGVAVSAVARRRRQSGLLRPPPNKVRPPITRERLVRQLAAGTTRADIATAHHVGLATVTRWCAHYGIDVVGPPRPASGRGVEPDPKELRRLYVDAQWSARLIGDHLGADAKLVTFALHSYRIPVRHGSHGNQADAVVLLDALYADRDVVGVLEHHGVPLGRSAGRLARRFPHPPPLAADLIVELYRDVGPSTTHISLLTGHSTSNVCDVLRHHGTPTRPRQSIAVVRTHLPLNPA
jgi:transposase